jgi:Xaa-Pro aminopeptidase
VNDRQDEYDLFELVKTYQQRVSDAGLLTDDYLLGKIMARLREIKSPEELELLQRAIDISTSAHVAMMKNVQPGQFEYEVEAVGEFEFHRQGAEEIGYPSICGSAENSVILHYEKNRRRLTDGELLLLDMGAEYHGYTADITRTLPVSGSFSPEQRAVYDLVLKAQEAGIAACLPGKRFREPHEAAFAVIEEGLIKLGITKSADETKKYFPHGTSHYLGLDVHDAGDFEPLKAGEVITVEPGIYIPAGSPCDPKWWNIGIRIEDDVLITGSEPINLSGKLPRTVPEIEKTMKEVFLNPSK